jgi:hypothetical protein
VDLVLATAAFGPDVDVELIVLGVVGDTEVLEAEVFIVG